MLGAFTEANVNPGPESFYLKMRQNQKLTNTLDFIKMELDGIKVVTYQALVRVSGKTRFRLVNSVSAGVVYDEIVLSPDGADTGWTLLTLRGQLKASGGANHFRVRIENLNTGTGTSNYARFKFLSQQAWGGKQGNSTYPLELGLANATLVSTPDNAPTKNTYPWSVNALSVMAQSRFRLPAKPSRYGWEQRGLIDTPEADLRDGDVTYDTDQKAVLMVMNQNQMFCVHQPERKANKSASFTWAIGDEKNMVFVASPGSGDRVITLPTSANEVPDGTIVRVYKNADATGYTAKVKFGSGGTEHTIDSGKMGEYVFTGGTWRSVVHNAAFVAQ